MCPQQYLNPFSNTLYLNGCTRSFFKRPPTHRVTLPKSLRYCDVTAADEPILERNHQRFLSIYGPGSSQGHTADHRRRTRSTPVSTTRSCGVLQRPQHMFYYPQRAVNVHTSECSSGSVPQALHDHCANVNLASQAFAEWKSWRIIPTSASLSTGTDVGRKVLGTVDTEGAVL